MNELRTPAESIAKVDLLLGQATILTVDRWDDVSAMIHEGMGISLSMAATHPSREPVALPELDRLTVLECIEQALREVHSWDLALALDLPDLARLRVLLTDIRRALGVAPERRA